MTEDQEVSLPYLVELKFPASLQLYCFQRVVIVLKKNK